MGLALGGVLGPAGIGIMATSATIATAGMAVLVLWIIFCRDCLLMRFLQRFFGAMALLLAALSAVFVLLGLIPFSVGASAVAALFGVMVAALSIGIAVLGCP